MKISDISKGLLEDLRQVYPNKLPEKELTSHEMGVLLGQQTVLRYLEHQYRKQNPLTSTT